MNAIRLIILLTPGNAPAGEVSIYGPVTVTATLPVLSVQSIV